ncbi:MAG: LemA family protein [Thermoguttaceae bacterium]|nr:LemA family protein [Thermoguttaceae bacterium]
MGIFAGMIFALGGGLIALIAILAVAFFVLLWAVGVYNGLVRSRNNYKNAFAQIDVQLKRRYDLIPNLVEAVKGYMAHERGTLEAVIQARNAAINAQKAASQDPGNPDAMKQLGAAEGELTGALSRLMVVCEAYPDLKANQNMLELQEELTSTENKVAFARQAYNDAVTSYNNMREVFPANLVAGFGGFGPAALLEIENQEERTAPKVSF